MKHPPCIRGLRAYKKGCPQRPWNGESGCPAWIEKQLPTKGGTETTRIAECLDMFMMRLHYDANRLLEGNQQAIETFRNNMSEPGQPKPDPILARMLVELQPALPLVQTGDQRRGN